MRKPTTIQDVARIAGVSTATVSRTLSTPGIVAETTRSIVMDAVRATGFRRNSLAANLRRQRTGSVIALVPNLANPFFSQILAGIASVLAASGYGLLVADTRTGPDADSGLSHYLGSSTVDGLILLDGALSSFALELPHRRPIVAACEWFEGPIPSVRIENGRGAEMAVRHLAALGHRRIGHVTGPPGNVLTSARLEGFRSALSEVGLEQRPEWVFQGDFTLRSGEAAARSWLGLPDRPSGIFCASDEMALGFMGAVQHAGLSVPGDLSLVGFDNIEATPHLTPALTTIHQPRMLIGERAATLLLGMINRREIVGPSEIIPVELIVRSSTAVFG